MDFTLRDSGADETCVSDISTQFSAEEDDGKNKKASQHVQTQHTVVGERQVTSLFFCPLQRRPAEVTPLS